MQRRDFLRGLSLGIGAAAVPAFGLCSLEQRAAALKVDWGEFTHSSRLSYVWDPETHELCLVNGDPVEHTVHCAITGVGDDDRTARLWVVDEHGRAVPRAGLPRF